MAKKYETVEHRFGSRETVHAVLKYYNDNQMTEDELYMARVYFFAENGSTTRKAGDIVLVPILPQYQKD